MLSLRPTPRRTVVAAVAGAAVAALCAWPSLAAPANNGPAASLSWSADLTKAGTSEVNAHHAASGLTVANTARTRWASPSTRWRWS